MPKKSTKAQPHTLLQNIPTHLYLVLTTAALITLALYFLTSVAPYLFSSQKPLQKGIISGIFSPEYDFQDQQGIFHGRNFPTIFSPDTPTQSSSQVLGYPSYKRIEIDLSLQRLYTFEGENLIHNFLISSGKWGRTPTGTFTIWTKLRYTKMEGGNKAINTYYYLPNVPYTMFFANDEIPAWRGFGIHGTYWHNNFGTPMSHGCVNMKTEEAALVYAWANPTIPEDKKSVRATADNPGTTVVIYGKAPQK
ncbi:MAG: hypothetical protein KatS3mg087_0824 [Patescibacteria group bacterium]|nr:MAG: hypothetical protein KatS3mg087_0824 [Patescibacteria group bacterium]